MNEDSQIISLPYPEITDRPSRDATRAALNRTNMEAFYVDIENIEFRPGFNPRRQPKWMSWEDWLKYLKIELLANSILENPELIPPIIGDLLADEKTFVTTEGYRRTLANKWLRDNGHDLILPNGKSMLKTFDGKWMVKVVMNPKDITEQDRFKISIMSQNNLKLPPMDMAFAVLRAKDTFKMSNDKLKTFFQNSRQWVDNMINLTTLSEADQELLEREEITVTEALKRVREVKKETKAPKTAPPINPGIDKDEDAGEVKGTINFLPNKQLADHRTIAQALWDLQLGDHEEGIAAYIVANEICLTIQESIDGKTEITPENELRLNTLLPLVMRYDEEHKNDTPFDDGERVLLIPALRNLDVTEPFLNEWEAYGYACKKVELLQALNKDGEQLSNADIEFMEIMDPLCSQFREANADALKGHTPIKYDSESVHSQEQSLEKATDPKYRDPNGRKKDDTGDALPLVDFKKQKTEAEMELTEAKKMIDKVTISMTKLSSHQKQWADDQTRLLEFVIRKIDFAIDTIKQAADKR